jgi:hypothetical protein
LLVRGSRREFGGGQDDWVSSIPVVWEWTYQTLATRRKRKRGLRTLIRKYWIAVSFEIYLHAFENGAPAERAGSPLRGLLLAAPEPGVPDRSTGRGTARSCFCDETPA